MHIDMYRTFFDIQKKHWWFVTKKDVVLDTISRFVKPTNQTRFLDIGCGSGLMLESLSAIGPTSGMDMSDEAIAFSKEIYSGDIAQGSLPDKVPYEAGRFEVVTALDVVEHIDQDVESLKTIHALLSNNGVAIITVPAYMFLWTEFDVMNHHKRRYTLPEMKRKLESSGFSVEKISYYNTFLFPIVAVVRLANKVSKRDGGSDVDMPSAQVNAVLRFIFGLEKYVLRYLNMPFGVSVIAVARKIE